MFVSYIQQHLAATLNVSDILIMDHLASHEVHGVREAVEARGTRLLYLPPYRPDLNPIELVFSKFKWLLRTTECRNM